MQFDDWTLGQDIDARKSLLDGIDGPRTVAGWWRAIVAKYGDQPAMEYQNQHLSFNDLEERSASLARGLLVQGAGKGTRIGILFPNGIDWLVSWIAVQRIGAVAVTLSTFYAPAEMRYALRHGDVALLLCAAGYLRHDYRARLAEALPELIDQDGTGPLVLTQCPYLRSIWFDQADRPGWSHGSLADLQRNGASSAAISADILAQVEAMTSPADIGTMIFTSGSTAEPKAVVHVQDALVDKTMRMAMMNSIIPAHTQSGDRMLITMPFFWVGGFLSMTGGLALGATVVCEDDHSPEHLLRTIRDRQITQFTATAALLATVASVPEYRPGDLAQLKMEHIAQVSWFTTDWPHGGREMAGSLGMTESCGPHSGEWLEVPLPDHLLGSQGRVLDGMEWRLVDPETGAIVPEGEAGELCIRGIWLMDGFYKRLRRDVFDADGFYHTGDECRITPEGHLFVHGRLGGMIKTAGANVSPEEVELALRTIDGVIEPAVFALNHPARGQTVTAVVVARPESGLSEANLKAALKSQLSSFKIPRHILFMDRDDLPRTPSDKVRRPALAQMVAKAHPEWLEGE